MRALLLKTLCLAAPAANSYHRAMHLGYRLFPAIPLVFFAISLANGEDRKLGHPCTFDAERPNLPNCLQKASSGRLFVSANYLLQLSFNRFGLAAVYSREEGWMYVNHKGGVVVSGVAEMDNWADSFHNGLVRVVKSKKYGYANQNGAMVIPAIYDGALNFRNGTAQVCRTCRCDDPRAEHCTFVGGEWFRIDTHGRVVARLDREAVPTPEYGAKP